MTFLVFKKCCLCVDLRLGSFFIGYFMLISRLSVLMVTSIRLAQTKGILHHDVGIVNEDLAFHRMMGIISLMVLVFEILLNLALVVGLHKRLDQHVEMFYVGSFFFSVVGIVLLAVMLLRYARLLGSWTWFFVAVDIVSKIILVYFLMVIRSYYYKMKEEEKEDTENLEPQENGKKYFERTQPVLFGLKV